MSPRCLAFSLFATVRSGQKRPALSSSSPSPSPSPLRFASREGREGEGGMHRNANLAATANLYYPRPSRKRERDSPLDRGQHARGFALRPGPGINLSSNLSSTSRRNADTMPESCLSFQLRAPLGISSSFQTKRDSSSISIPRFSDSRPSTRRILLRNGIFRSGISKKSKEKVCFSSQAERISDFSSSFSLFGGNLFLVPSDHPSPNCFYSTKREGGARGVLLAEDCGKRKLFRFSFL